MLLDLFFILSSSLTQSMPSFTVDSFSPPRMTGIVAGKKMFFHFFVPLLIRVEAIHLYCT